MRKTVVAGLIVLMASASAFASRKDEITLVMVPREDNVVRVGLDLANRYPTLLVSYKVNGGVASLHGWTGKEWVNIAVDAFKAGDFFRTGPDSALIIDEDNALADSLLPAEDWCPAVYKITTTETRPLLHLTGQYYDFGYKDWKWFCENYKMSMEAINPEGLNVAWYHKRFSDNLKNKPVAADDLKFWMAVRHPLPAVTEAVVENERAAETNSVESAVQPEMETPEDAMLMNPLTNEVPEAVVVGSDKVEDLKKDAGEARDDR
ncbi:hypothetical protein [Pontiella agarivorans]|uniref:Uncharacterized protein n=1 Tax=Pontiella agarivorans TaxID=3038953 RepID=A0ABU5MTA6_9BACT|nr:hypothetical protein [Pontiella agarivorans]MDZ8117377.1 hypothetical protein [Pontiella agarivorans]